jgi:hypothetical protein
MRDRLGSGDPPWGDETVVVRGEHVESSVLEGEAVLLHLDTGVYYTLNRVGTVVWELVSGPRSLVEIVRALCDRFDVSEEVAREDLRALLADLREEGLVREERM